MKKLLLTIALAAATTSVFAQGTIVFANNTGKVMKYTSSTDSTPVAVAKNGGVVQMFYAPTGTPLVPYSQKTGETSAAFLEKNAGWFAGPIASLTTPTAGNFSGGTKTLTGIGAGAAVDAVVIGWTGTYATLDLALAPANWATLMTGSSAKFTMNTGNPTTTPAGVAVNMNTVFPGVTLVPVPEPSTLALAGLGAAALMIFRRRK